MKKSLTYCSITDFFEWEMLKRLDSFDLGSADRTIKFTVKNAAMIRFNTVRPYNSQQLQEFLSRFLDLDYDDCSFDRRSETCFVVWAPHDRFLDKDLFKLILDEKRSEIAQYFMGISMDNFVFRNASITKLDFIA